MNRPRRSRLALLMFFYFLVITFSVYVIKPAKDSLFLDALGREKLPLAFLLTAVLMGLAVAVNTRLLQKLNRPVYISSSLLFFAASGSLFWYLVKQPAPQRWIYLLLYSWGDILLVTAVTQFWIFINDLFPPREAKRQIGFFISGGLLGGIGGSLMALSRPGHFQTEDLILLGPVVLVICLAIVFCVQRQAKKKDGGETEDQPGRQKEQAGFFQSFLQLKSHRYLLLLSGMILASIIVSNLIDFQFKSVAETAYPQKNLRTSFFGTFYLAVLVLSSVFTAFGSSRLLKNLHSAVLILPGLLLAGSLVVFLLPGAGIAWAVAVKGTDKSLSHSLNQSLRELLYIPLPQNIKYRAKVFIDMFLNKFADGLAGLVLIAIGPLLKFHVEKVSFLVIGFLFLWIYFGRRILKEYVTIVKSHLQIKWQDADRVIGEHVDIDLTKLVIDTLENRERSSVLYAMNCFELIKKEKMSPQLKNLIAFKSDEIRARGMGSLLDVSAETLGPEFDDELTAESLDAEIKEIMALDVYNTLMKERIEKIAADRRKEAEVSRMEAAKLIGMMTAEESLRKELRRLLKDPSPEVVRYAAESAGRLRRRELVPLLIGLLGRASTQEAAAGALSMYGPSILGQLSDFLRDPKEDIRIRRAIPGIMARIGSERAARLLVREIEQDHVETETEVIEALHRMRWTDSQLAFSPQKILKKTASLLKKCYLLLCQIHELRPDKKREILARDLEGNLSRTLKNIFYLLGLIYPQEDIVKAYQNILAGTRRTLDYSVELLDTLLPREIKELLLPLVEDTTFEYKVSLSRRMIKAAEKLERS